jgi:hypothetical protein
MSCDVVDHLTCYARGLPVEYGCRVTRVHSTPAGYRNEEFDMVAAVGDPG